MNTTVDNAVDSIVGVWSHDVLFGPGAAADEVLVFRPDGTGVCEIYNWMLCSYDTFTWVIESDGSLTIHGQDSFDGPSTRSLSSLSASSIPFRITSEQTPVHGTTEVLHLRLAEWLPDRFGRTKENVADYVLPEFERNV